jgi:hypothetical protein
MVRAWIFLFSLVNGWVSDSIMTLRGWLRKKIFVEIIWLANLEGMYVGNDAVVGGLRAVLRSNFC